MPVANDGVRSRQRVVGVFEVQVHKLVGVRQIVVHARAQGLLRRSTAHAVDAKADKIVTNEQVKVAGRWPIEQRKLTLNLAAADIAVAVRKRGVNRLSFNGRRVSR